MPERIQKILNRVLEWWNRFTVRQKTLIIIIVAAVIMALAILITVLNRPEYVLLGQYDNTNEASEVNDILQSANITPKVSSDGLRIEVDKKQESAANLLLGANNIQSAAYSIENVTSGGFAATEADKQRRYEVFLESKLANEMLGALEAVKSARVDLTIPENNGFLIETQEEAYASIVLELVAEFSEEQAASLARSVATALGNKTTENITILDTQSNMLFSGASVNDMFGVAGSQLSYQSKVQAQFEKNVKQVLMATGQYAKVEVSPNIIVDFSSQEKVENLYWAPDGREEGMQTHEESYVGDSTNAVAGIPGTDSNGENGNSYQYLDGGGSSSSEAEEAHDYVPNNSTTTTTLPPGSIIEEESSVSVALTSYVVLTEDDANNQGLLDGTSWEAYKSNNQEITKVDVDPDIINMVSKATGIAVEDIEVLAYSQYMFYDSAGLNISPNDIAMYIVIAAMVGMLIFIMIRIMRTNKETLQEEELSVESLLQSQPELALEDISVDQGSESKKLIDRFVEENPEAAAALLRNWLNEEWA